MRQEHAEPGNAEPGNSEEPPGSTRAPSHHPCLVSRTCRYWPELAKDVRPLYSAPTEAAARSSLDEFEAKWGERYRAITRLWQNAWAGFVPSRSYSPKPQGHLFDGCDFA
jgi:hypothetical protein